jgi:DnaJ-class molecular chaperone with C-terminal Zn finger domain
MTPPPDTGDNFSNLQIKETADAVVIIVKEGCWFVGAGCNPVTLQQVKYCVSNTIIKGTTNIIFDLKFLYPVTDEWIHIITSAYRIVVHNHGHISIANAVQEVLTVIDHTKLSKIFKVCDIEITITYYDILNISPDATDDDILKSYLALNEEYGCRWLEGEQEANVIMNRVETAFDVLTDPSERKKYDDLITREKSYGTKHVDADQPTCEPSAQIVSKEDQVMMQRYSKPLLIAFGIIVVALSLAWGERYKPLGSAGQFVYLHDRFTGDLVTLVGPYKVSVTAKEQSGYNR